MTQCNRCRSSCPISPAAIAQSRWLRSTRIASPGAFALAFNSLRAALRAGLGVTVRVIEMLTPDLRVLTEAEGLPRLPNMHLDLYLRDERVSPPARRLFESIGEAAARLPARSHRARLRPRHGSLRA